MATGYSVQPRQGFAGSASGSVVRRPPVAAWVVIACTRKVDKWGDGRHSQTGRGQTSDVRVSLCYDWILPKCSVLGTQGGQELVFYSDIVLFAGPVSGCAHARHRLPPSSA